jgi:hypothetical protein
MSDDLITPILTHYKHRTRTIIVDCSVLDDMAKSATFYPAAYRSNAAGTSIADKPEVELGVTLTVAQMLADPEIAADAAEAFQRLVKVANVINRRHQAQLLAKLQPAEEPTNE